MDKEIGRATQREEETDVGKYHIFYKKMKEGRGQENQGRIDIKQSTDEQQGRDEVECGSQCWQD